MKLTHLLIFLIFCFSGSLARAQEPFIGHYIIPGGLDSRFVAFEASPLGGYMGVAYSGDGGYRCMDIFRFSDAGDTLWTRKYPTPGAYGAMNRFPIAADIAPDGGLYILLVQIIPQVQANIVFRTNASGDSLWSTTVSPVEQWASPPFYAIRTHPDGGCVIAGGSNGFPTAATVTRLTDDGTVSWVTRGFDGDYGYNAFHEVDVNTDGAIFATGKTQNNISGNQKVLTAMVNKQGGIEWSKVYFSGLTNVGDSITGYGTSVVATPDGGCIFGGWASDPGQLGGSALLQKLDSAGNTDWVQRYFRWDYIYQQGRVLNLATHTSGNYLCLIHQNYGYTNATPTLMKFNPQGDSLWTQYGVSRKWLLAGTDQNDQILLYGNEAHPGAGWWEHVMVVRATSGGVFNSPQLFIPGNQAYGIRLNPVLEWVTDHTGTFTLQVATDSLFSNLVINQPGIGKKSYEASGLVSNTAYYWRVKTFGPEGGGSAWSRFYRFTTGDFSGLEDPWSMVNDLNIYPNPASSKVSLNFTLKEAQPLALIIRNLAGQTIFTREHAILSAGGHRFELDVAAWPEGIYIYELRAGDDNREGKIVVGR